MLFQRPLFTAARGKNAFYSSFPSRPLSPHLTIYQPQLTWILSIGHRMSGALLGSALYSVGIINAIYYHHFSHKPHEGLFEPLKNFFIEHSSVSCPYYTGTLVIGKSLIAFPILFHYLNGIRHLIWDLGIGLSLKISYLTGWSVVTLSSIASIYFAYFS